MLAKIMRKTATVGRRRDSISRTSSRDHPLTNQAASEDAYRACAAGGGGGERMPCELQVDCRFSVKFFFDLFELRWVVQYQSVYD